MRLLLVVLIALVGLVQYPLWLGKGGWFRVWELQGQVAEQREVNEGLRARNAALAAEVQDLMTGTGALEERARGDLGMMRETEVFVQILPHDEKPPAGARPNGDAAGIKPAAAAAVPARPATTATVPASRGAVPAAARGTIGPATAPAPARTGTAPARATDTPANAAATRPAAASRTTPARPTSTQPAAGPAVATPIPAPASAPR